RGGWEEQKQFVYQTSPAEHRTVAAYAARKGPDWAVAIIDGNTATLEKRLGPINAILQSRRAPGHVRETFQSRAAHRLDPARVAALVDFVRDAAAMLGVPGVGLALIDHGEVVYEGGVGVRELGRPEPVDAHTRFMVGSNTKGMATLLLARLVDQGRLNWDAPVTEVYPAFRLGSDETTRQVLVRHLVSAFTGLPRKDYEWIFNTTAETSPETTFTQLAATEPTSRFGEVFQYNNLMAAAAGYVGAHVAHPDRTLGEAFDAAMQELVFDPLAMDDTTFSMSVALAGNHASPHGKDADGKVRVVGYDVANAIMPIRPAGAAWSSPRDMILYVRNELAEGVLPNGRRLVTSENLLARRVRGAPMGEAQWYGMGLSEDATWGVSVIGHGGGLPGYLSDWFAIPSAQIGAVVLTNSSAGGLMLRPFLRRLIEVLYDGRPEAAENLAAAAQQVETQRAAERTRLTIPVAPADVAGLANAYANADLGPLAVERTESVVRFRTRGWTSEVASRHNDDGTVSLVTIDPSIGALGFDVGTAHGKPTLTTRDGQHVYEYLALD
ncbi:MAG TPA: serine hydrolase domain-containing protein, partial [Caulobacteraceae bacterium]|nr:serine hydrolase domain-containing protein [Caulobacteraceae bacterium]